MVKKFNMDEKHAKNSFLLNKKGVLVLEKKLKKRL